MFHDCKGDDSEYTQHFVLNIIEAICAKSITVILEGSNVFITLRLMAVPRQY